MKIPGYTPRHGTWLGRCTTYLNRLMIVPVLAGLMTVGMMLAPTSSPEQSKSVTEASSLLETARDAFGVQSASAANPATWLMNWLYKSQTKARGTQMMQGLGYTCPIGGTVFTCYFNTSYDPPRWFYYGVVQTGNGPYGYVNARSWSTTSDSVVRTFREGWKLVIFCQTTGSWVYGRWGWTNVWDYVGHLAGTETPMFVSDGFVYTGRNGFVAGDCGATNFGDNPIGSATAM